MNVVAAAHVYWALLWTSEGVFTAVVVEIRKRYEIGSCGSAL